MTTPIPARYQRAGSSKIVGCLVYLVVTPFVALFLALFLAVPLMFALEALGLSRDRASAPFPVLLPLFGLGVAVWGYRDYRQRATLEVVIDRDQVTIGIDSRRTVLRFDDVVSIRLVPTRVDFACILVPRSGRVVRLPSEIAPFSLVREPLENSTKATNDLNALTVVSWRLAKLPVQADQNGEAERSYEQATQLYQVLSNRDPKSVDFRSKLADSHHFLGKLQAESNRLEAPRNIWSRPVRSKSSSFATIPTTRRSAMTLAGR